ncbi:MAG: preprotein translocase subunit SecE [Lachnospiraceae bacterium]|nr:preprotein translocase subunit SecE [Lachnospiraceae bacterium]
MSENAVKKAKKPSFFKGVKAEFKKITWPDKTSLFKQTAAVIGVSLVVGVIIAVMDFIIQYGVNFLLTL